MPRHLEPQQLSPAMPQDQKRKQGSKVSVGTLHLSIHWANYNWAPCVYQKPRSARNGDEVRQGLRVILLATLFLASLVAGFWLRREG